MPDEPLPPPVPGVFRQHLFQLVGAAYLDALRVAAAGLEKVAAKATHVESLSPPQREATAGVLDAVRAMVARIEQEVPAMAAGLVDEFLADVEVVDEGGPAAGQEEG